LLTQGINRHASVDPLLLLDRYRAARLRLKFRRDSFGDARPDGSEDDGGPNPVNDLLVKDARNDILLVQFIVRHDGRDRFGCSQLHLVVDPGRTAIECASEDAGEAVHIVDLVRIIASPCGEDATVPRDR